MARTMRRAKAKTHETILQFILSEWFVREVDSREREKLKLRGESEVKVVQWPDRFYTGFTATN